MSQNIDFQTAASDLFSCAVYLAEKIKSSDGYAEAMSSLVNVSLEKNDVDGAAAFADSINDSFSRDAELLKVVAKCVELRDFDYAFQLCEAAENEADGAIGFEQIAYGKIAANQIDEALKLAENTSDYETIYGNAALKNYANGDAEKAFELIDKITTPEIKANFLLNFAEKDLKENLKSEAIESIEEALQFARQVEVDEQKIYSLLPVCYSFSEANRKDRQIEVLSEAFKTAEKIDSVHRNHLLSLVSKAFLEAGSVDLADRALDLIDDKTVIASTLAAYSNVFKEQENRVEAGETLQEAIGILKSQTDREIRDSKARYAVLGRVAVDFANLGKFEEAVAIARDNPLDSERFTSLSKIAKIAAAAENKDDLAQTAVNSIDLEEEKIAAKISVSDSKEEIGNREAAKSILKDCVADLETIDQAFAKFNLLNELCRRFQVYGELDLARDCAEKMLENASQIKDESRRVNAIAELSEIHRRHNFQLNEIEKEILQTMLRRAEW